MDSPAEADCIAADYIPSASMRLSIPRKIVELWFDGRMVPNDIKSMCDGRVLEAIIRTDVCKYAFSLILQDGMESKAKA